MRTKKYPGLRRMLAASITTSRKVNRLRSDEARLLYTWMISHTDDYGHLEADPESIKAKVVPLLNHFTLGKISEILDELEDDQARTRLIFRYEVGGESYLEILGFDKFQSFSSGRVHKYPFPPKSLADQFIGDNPSLFRGDELNIEGESSVNRGTTKLKQTKLKQTKLNKSEELSEEDRLLAEAFFNSLNPLERGHAVRVPELVFRKDDPLIKKEVLNFIRLLEADKFPKAKVFVNMALKARAPLVEILGSLRAVLEKDPKAEDSFAYAQACLLRHGSKVGEEEWLRIWPRIKAGEGSIGSIREILEKIGGEHE